MPNLDITDEELKLVAAKLRGVRPPMLARRQKELRDSLLNKIGSANLKQHQDGTNTITLLDENESSDDSSGNFGVTTSS